MSFLRIRFPLLMALLWVLLSLMWGCGASEECTKTADCLDNPSFGAGYTCAKSEGKNVCTKGCPSSCTQAGDCQKCTGGKTFCVEGKCGFEPLQCPSSCTADADCLNCDSGKNSCLGGICAAKTPTCPSSCTADAECGPCADGNNFCVTGTCGKKVECPAACAQDAECAGCADDKTKCLNSVCDKDPDPPKCPAACTADPDCASCPDQRTTCTSGTCQISQQTQCPSSCSNDGDCSNCASGLNFCVTGKCSKKQDPQCPATCSASADCANCPDSRTTCNNGACEKAQNPQCPSSCSNDADCSQCSADQQTCISGKCDQKQNPQCPSSCVNDTDCSNCAAGQQQCVNSACGQPAQCPATCTANADCAPCAAGQQTCTAGKCGLPPACPGSCLVNSDCSKCTNGDIACVSGKCGKPTTCPGSCTQAADCVACGGNFDCTQNKCQSKKPPLTGPGQECSATNRCITGDICINVDTKSYCFQDCSSDATLCNANTVDGRTKCTAFAQDTSGNTISVCLGESTKGQACGYGVQNQSECTRGQSPPLYCTQKSLCEEATVQTKAGDACNKSTDNTDPLKICDAASQLVCSETTGKCEVAAAAKEGEECDPTGANLGKVVVCDTAVSGLTCVRFDTAGTINYCQLTCNPQGTSECKHKAGLTCEPLLSGGRGLCMDATCTKDADCAFTNYICNAQTSGNLCVPPTPAGPKKFTEICGAPARTNGCISSLFCLSEQGKADGFCTVDCTQSGTVCPRSGTLSSSCQTINSTTGTKACLFLCSSASRTCPTGLTCNTNLGLCLAP